MSFAIPSKVYKMSEAVVRLERKREREKEESQRRGTNKEKQSNIRIKN